MGGCVGGWAGERVDGWVGFRTCLRRLCCFRWFVHVCVWVLLMLELVVEPPKLLKWTAARVCKCYYINGGLLDCDGTARLPRVCTCLLS